MDHNIQDSKELDSRIKLIILLLVIALLCCAVILGLKNYFTDSSGSSKSSAVSNEQSVENHSSSSAAVSDDSFISSSVVAAEDGMINIFAQRDSSLSYPKSYDISLENFTDENLIGIGIINTIALKTAIGDFGYEKNIRIASAEFVKIGNSNDEYVSCFEMTLNHDPELKMEAFYFKYYGEYVLSLNGNIQDFVSDSSSSDTAFSSDTAGDSNAASSSSSESTGNSTGSSEATESENHTQNSTDNSASIPNTLTIRDIPTDLLNSFSSPSDFQSSFYNFLSANGLGSVRECTALPDYFLKDGIYTFSIRLDDQRNQIVSGSYNSLSGEYGYTLS